MSFSIKSFKVCAYGVVALFSCFLHSAEIFRPQRQWALDNSYADPLRAEIFSSLKNIAEFESLREIAQKHGAKVYLIGGSVVSLSHFSKWRLMQKLGQQKFIPSRLDQRLHNFVRLDQDVDFVVDVDLPQEQARQVTEKIVAEINHRFPRFQADWQAIGMRFAIDQKDAVLSESFFDRQHLDSYSRILLDLSAADPKQMLIDPLDLMHKQKQVDSHFLNDILGSKIRFFASPKLLSGQATAKEWNPEFMSAMRAMVKASQFAATFDDRDMSSLKNIVSNFNVKANHSQAFLGRLKSRAPKLLTQALDLEYSAKLIAESGLRSKLLELSAAYPEYLNNYPAILRRVPLTNVRIEPVSFKPKVTAKDLGIEYVVHETTDALALESITWSPDGSVNAFVSRVGAVGEAAVSGDGFYTRIVDDLLFKTGASFKMKISHDAVEGIDFKISENKKNLVLLNSAKVQIEPTSLPYQNVLSLWSALGNHSIGVESKAKAETLMTSFMGQIENLSQHDLELLLKATESLVEKNKQDINATLSWQLRIWFSSANPIAHKHPDFLLQLVEAKAEHSSMFLRDLFAQERISINFYEKNPEVLESIFKKINFDFGYAELFAKSIYKSELLKANKKIWQALSVKSKKSIDEILSTMDRATEKMNRLVVAPAILPLLPDKVDSPVIRSSENCANVFSKIRTRSPHTEL